MRALSQLICVACVVSYDTRTAAATDLNADIVGKGVQFSIFAPAACTIVASLLGHFHVANSGAKELGQAILFSEYTRKRPCCLSADLNGLVLFDRQPLHLVAKTEGS